MPRHSPVFIEKVVVLHPPKHTHLHLHTHTHTQTHTHTERERETHTCTHHMVSLLKAMNSDLFYFGALYRSTYSQKALGNAPVIQGRGLTAVLKVISVISGVSVLSCRKSLITPFHTSAEACVVRGCSAADRVSVETTRTRAKRHAFEMTVEAVKASPMNSCP